MARALILGTAGHIDHGKTSLIRALTGIETDRLPEEKRRGITIELGFAHLEIDGFQLGIVDVPGHEKYVRHMLAGATGMDLALLVVACDEGVKRQTREHVDILKLLRVPVGVVALTKCDLVEESWIELVREEVAELVRDSFLEKSETVSVSARTGQGLDDLRDALLRAAASADAIRSTAGRLLPFRLSIDRVFALTGFGTVVTGTVHSGSLSPGDSIEIQPGGLAARIRQLQSHGREVARIEPSQRAAINVAGVHHDQLRRGQEIAAIGFLRPSRLMSCELTLLASIARPLKDRSRIKLHLGTAELTAVVRLLDRAMLEPGHTSLVQFYLNEPAVAVWGQAFVIRQESPAETIGGGRVLNPTARPLEKNNANVIALLQAWGSSDEVQRLEATLFYAGDFDGSPNDWARWCGIPPRPELLQQLVEMGRLDSVADTPNRNQVIHVLRTALLAEQIEHWLKRMHARNPMQKAFPLQQVLQAFEKRKMPAAITKLAVQRLIGQSRVEAWSERIALTGFGPKLSKAEQQLLDALTRRLRAAGLAVPTVKELQQEYAKLEKSVLPLLHLLLESQEVVKLSPDLFIHAETLAAVKSQLSLAFRSQPQLTLAEIREVLQTTRKYAVPMAEYLDQVGFTRRHGDKRTLNLGP